MRAAALVAAAVGSHAMSVENVPSGLRLRGGVDLGKVAQGISGVLRGSSVDQSKMSAGAGTPTLGLKGGGEVLLLREYALYHIQSIKIAHTIHHHLITP